MEISPVNDSGGDTNSTDNDDIIPSLLNETPFKIRPDNEKLSIVHKGRPLPKLFIVKRDSTRNCNRTFQGSWYGIHRWLCGSKQYNKLFCWPCVLMRPESSSWCSTGNDDMKRLSSMASKHSICKSHLKAITEYDATLIGYGLLPEFVNETKKDNQRQEPVNGSDSEDCFDIYFTDDQKSKKNESAIEGNNSKLKKNLNDTTHKVSESKSHISFKVWQELSRQSHPFNHFLPIENAKLFKWKRKIARQELKNAQLTGQKIKIEIELLRTKINYLKSINSSPKPMHMETPVTMSSIVPMESIDSSVIKNKDN